MPDDEQVRLLREIARWTGEAALPFARDRVTQLLDTDPKKRVYAALADGSSTITAVEKSTGANHNDIGIWVKVWEAEGIVEIGANPRALFTLTELGIEPAPPKVPRKKGGAAT